MADTADTAGAGMLTTATADTFLLGEGPVWDAAAGLIRWVDIIGRRVLAGRLRADGTIDVVADVSTDHVPTAVLPTTDGRIGLAIDGGLLIDGDVIAQVIDDTDLRRTNDAKSGPDGRLIVGTLAYDTSTDAGAEVLVCIEPDGQVTPLDSDIGLSNGIAWTTDTRTMYSVDTVAGIVYARDLVDGVYGARRVHLALDGLSPDGCCTDAEDHLWIAMWGDAAVHRYAPDGTLVRVIEVPALQPTSVAFVGDRLDLLCITSAGVDVTPDRARGADGALFTIDVGVRGVPVSPWQAPQRDALSRKGQE